MNPEPTFVNSKVHAYVLSALNFMGKYGINADSPKWARARITALRGSAADTKYSQTYGSLMLATWAAGDPIHSAFHSPAGSTAIDEELGDGDQLPTVDTPFPGVAELTVPTHVGQDAAKSAAYVAAGIHAISAAAAAASCGWILDLRGDGGGNVYPMLGAVSPLLPQGKLVSLVDRNQNVTWITLTGSTISHTGRTAGDRFSFAVPGQTSTFAAMPIAVLQGAQTASSGEAVLLAFKGQSRVRTFGARSAGLASANIGKTMPDGATLTLTTAWTSNRSGEIYKKGVPAEVETTTDAGTDAAARRWLEGQCEG